MSKLAKIFLNEWEFVFDPVDRHIRCLPHIFNICVQHVLNNYTWADFADCPAIWKNTSGKVIHKEPYIQSVRQHLIGHGREIVHSIRSSGQHHSNFQLTIKSGNEQESFANETSQWISLPVLELLHDVKTRWDSTYFMINHLRALRPVSTFTCSVSHTHNCVYAGCWPLLECPSQYWHIKPPLAGYGMGSLAGPWSDIRGKNHVQYVKWLNWISLGPFVHSKNYVQQGCSTPRRCYSIIQDVHGTMEVLLSTTRSPAARTIHL